MLNPLSLQIGDDSGLLAIVNADKYNSFVSEEWELTQLLNRFVDEMNSGNLIIWSTGVENTWTVSFVNKPSDKKSFREFSKTIKVTDDQLFLTNYEDLTIAAQYEDEKIPAKHSSMLCIKLDNGIYDFRIRQLFNPDVYELPTVDEVSFEIVIQPNPEMMEKQVDKVFWWTQ